MRTMGVTMLALFVAGLAVADASFTKEGMLVLDGKPRLVIGLYESPKDDAVLGNAAAAGFNLVCASTERASLDRLQKAGVYGWVPLGGTLSLPEGDAAAKARLVETVNGLKDHPALLAWEAPDESLWNNWYGPYDWFLTQQPAQLRQLIEPMKAQDAEKAARLSANVDRAAELGRRSMWPESEGLYAHLWQEVGAPNPHPDYFITKRIAAADRMASELTRGWREIAEIDSGHVLWQNHAPRNSVPDLRKYNEAVHAAGCDIYPVPDGGGHSDLRDRLMTSVGAYTERMRDGAPGKACWMVLQGFGWHDIREGAGADDLAKGRRPNWDETRFMAYNALVHGANAILYWGTAYIPKDSALWADMLKIAGELRALEPALVAPDYAPAPVAAGEVNWASFDGDQPVVRLRQAGDDWVLLAVNESHVGVAFQVTGLPPALEGKTLYRLYSDEEVTVSQGGFRDGMHGYNVHVYATSREFEKK